MKRQIEIFSAACPTCLSTIELVKRIACDACQVSILDMNDIQVAKRARDLGVHSLPAVVIDGRLASCCEQTGVSEQTLRNAGLGQA